MSNYYRYQEVGVKIAHRLFKISGWKVYGYHADNSDSMTDYWDPAYWNGIAEKNGYMFVFNNRSAAEPVMKKHYISRAVSTSAEIAEKIKKLKRMTVENGASQSEEESAKRSIKRLMEKAEAEKEELEKDCEVITIPGHLANPPRCNWHVEKDGIIIEKGAGMLKFSSVPDITFERCRKNWEEFNTLSEKEWKEEYIKDCMYRWNYTKEEAEKYVESAYASAKEDYDLLEKFNEFISKVDATCGGMVGDETDFYTYEKIKVVKHKKENKVVETEKGKVKDGQCFILKTSFNYGRFKGLVYRIHAEEFNGKVYYNAYKLNGKLTKECHGMASRNNWWHIGTDETLLTKWVDRGDISWCNIVEQEVPYEVEKVVKKKKTTEKTSGTSTGKNTKEKETEKTSEKIDVKKLTYEITEDTHTKTGEKIFLVKVMENLTKEEYKKVNKYIKNLGGYYSRFKHGFIFKEDPTGFFNDSMENKSDDTEEKNTEKNAKEKAETLEDVSTEIILENNLLDEWNTNKQKEYIQLLKKWIEDNSFSLTKEIINCIEIQELKEFLIRFMEAATDQAAAECDGTTEKNTKEKEIEFEITEDIHSKTKEKLWIVKPKIKMEKQSFDELKRKLAIMHGYYSSLKNGFIFKYDPTEKIYTSG